MDIINLLKEKIASHQKDLDILLELEDDMNSEKVLELSTELDTLIVKYHKLLIKASS